MTTLREIRDYFVPGKMWNMMLALCLMAMARAQPPTTQLPQTEETSEQTKQVTQKPTTSTTTSSPQETSRTKAKRTPTVKVEDKCVAWNIEFTDLRPALKDLQTKFKGQVEEYDQIDKYNTGIINNRERMIIAERTKPFSTAIPFCQMKNAKMVEMTRENHQKIKELKLEHLTEIWLDAYVIRGMTHLSYRTSENKILLSLPELTGHIAPAHSTLSNFNTGTMTFISRQKRDTSSGSDSSASPQRPTKKKKKIAWEWKEGKTS